jgi:hypothetical protein
VTETKTPWSQAPSAQAFVAIEFSPSTFFGFNPRHSPQEFKQSTACWVRRAPESRSTPSNAPPRRSDSPSISASNRWPDDQRQVAKALSPAEETGRLSKPQDEILTAWKVTSAGEAKPRRKAVKRLMFGGE